MSEGLNYAIVGATGAVGRQLVEILDERKLEVASLRLFATEKSAGEEIEFRGKRLKVESVTPESFRGVDIVFFTAKPETSKELVAAAVEHGAVVIDKSSYFRADDKIPLIVPEVNSDRLRDYLKKNIGRGCVVASPNGTTIQLAVVLKPLHDRAGLKRVIVSTYQAVSGVGQKGIDELSSQVMSLFNQREVTPVQFPHQIAFNCIPQVDAFLDTGYTKEEQKIVDETRKVLNLPELRISATAVRVPTFACHGETVNIETERHVSPDDARHLLRESPGLLVVDEPSEKMYPMGADLVGTDAVYVGRIRKDETVVNGLNLWIVADNLRKGSALNAVEIAEIAANVRTGKHPVVH